MTFAVFSRPSLVRRLVILAAGWSLAVLLASAIVLALLFQQAALRRFDQGLGELIDNLVAGTTIDDNGQVLAPAITDTRALRAYSGKYWQIAEPAAGGGIRLVVRSRSLWDSDLKAPRDLAAQLAARPGKPVTYDARGPLNEPLRARASQAKLPGRAAPVIFMAAEDRTPVDNDVKNFVAATAAGFLLLGVGLTAAVVIQVRVGLTPLFALRREIAQVRRGKAERVVQTYPTELTPLADELNALMAHNQEVVERQRTHVGNLAHALKTPLTVVMNAATARAPDLADTVIREAAVMRRQVDHHLARARAVGRRADGHSRANVWTSVDAVLRAVTRLYASTRFDLDGKREAEVAVERQDLDEILGNLIENAAKYGGGSVFVTVAPAEASGWCEIWIEDDGMGIPEQERTRIFDRGARLDTGKPGTGLGLAIVRDVADIYGGSVELGESEDLGGLMVKLKLPRAKA